MEELKSIKTGGPRTAATDVRTRTVKVKDRHDEDRSEVGGIHE